MDDVGVLKRNRNRRQFLKSCASAGALWQLGDLGMDLSIPRLDAADASLPSGMVQFSPQIEPLVRLLEDSSRSQLLEAVAQKIRSGTTYKEVLSALFLAGVRNIQPRPVGFKFHAVLVVNSAHLASLNSPDSDRWLPIFWALDYFKSSQARDVSEGDWTLPAVDEPRVPPAHRVVAAFQEAMDNWDEAKTDVATAGLARSASRETLFDLFSRYGARDFRDIGHKAIYVANAWRTLQTIGWHHAEPVLRSLAYALLERNGGNPAENDYEADRPGRTNVETVQRIRAGWLEGEPSADATRDLMGVLRQGNWSEACGKVVELLNHGISPASVWDAFFQHAAEMMMRRPGIVPLHACTSTNAIHYLFQQSDNDELRRYLLLQNAAFLTLFRRAGAIGDGIRIDTYAGAESVSGLDEIFENVSGNRIQAARRSVSFLEQSTDANAFIAAAQRLIYLKGNDSHDYKFSSAMLEDYRHLSPERRARFLAATVFWLDGNEKPDNRLVARTRAAFEV